MLKGTEMVTIPDTVNTDLVAHGIMLIIATKVMSGETHISLNKASRSLVQRWGRLCIINWGCCTLKRSLPPMIPSVWLELKTERCWNHLCS